MCDAQGLRPESFKEVEIARRPPAIASAKREFLPGRDLYRTRLGLGLGYETDVSDMYVTDILM